MGTLARQSLCCPSLEYACLPAPENPTYHPSLVTLEYAILPPYLRTYRTLPYVTMPCVVLRCPTLPYHPPYAPDTLPTPYIPT
jgi:hypothetical protein